MHRACISYSHAAAPAGEASPDKEAVEAELTAATERLQVHDAEEEEDGQASGAIFAPSGDPTATGRCHEHAQRDSQVSS